MKAKPTRIGEGLGLSEWLDESGRPVLASTIATYSAFMIPSLLMDRESPMETERFTEDEVTARAQQLANEQGPGWDTVVANERVGRDTAELRYWRERALQELEAEAPTVLEVEASTPKTVGLD
jgi:hypothetical protein